MLAVLFVIGAVQAVLIAVTAADQSPVVAAIIGGVFLIINSVLTYWLTGGRHERRARRRPRAKRKKQDGS